MNKEDSKKSRKLPMVPKFEEAIQIEQEQKLESDLNQFLQEVKQDQKKEEIKTKRFPPEINMNKIDDLFSKLKDTDKNNALNNTALNKQQSKNKDNLQNLKVDEKLKPKIISYSTKNIVSNIDDDYDPAKPNDYELLARQKQIKKDNQQIQQESEINTQFPLYNIVQQPIQQPIQQIQQPIIQQIQQPIQQIQQSIQQPIQQQIQQPIQQSNFQPMTEMQQEMKIEPSQMNYSSKSAEEKILSMMEKSGWKVGQGLGKNEQGMKTPLIAKKTNQNIAIIQNSEVELGDILSDQIYVKKNQTRVILLLNMIDEADTSLQSEVAEECSKYGTVLDVLIFLMKQKNDVQEQVRVFIEFEKVESAIQAYNQINRRIFNGNIVEVIFYNVESYQKGIYTD